MGNKKAPDRELMSFLHEVKDFFVEMPRWLKVILFAWVVWQIALLFIGDWLRVVLNIAAMVGGIVGAEIAYRFTR